MRNYERRKAFGIMLVDVIKYLFTAVIIGSFMTGKITVNIMIFSISIIAIFAIIAFFLIPPNKEG